MPITIPTSEPPVLTAGETALWQRDLSPDFPAPTWSLNYILTGPARIYLNSSANGAHHEINVAAATTANYVPGHYAVTARVSDGTSVFAVAVANPILQVRLNPAAQDVPLVTDPRSYAARTLELVEGAIASLAAKTVAQTTVNGTTYTLHDLDKLRALRAELLDEVRRERDAARTAAGLPSRRLIGVRFTRPS